MPEPRVLALDENLEDDRAENSSFGAPLTLLEYDIAIWDPGWVVENYEHPKKFKSAPRLSDEDSADFMRDRARRQSEMEEFLRLGRLLVVQVPSPRVFYIATGEEVNEGTKATPRIRRLVTAVNVEDLIPTSPMLHEARGHQMEVVGGQNFRDFWAKVSDQFGYAAFIEVQGAPLLRVPKTDRVVGALVDSEKGQILFLPQRSIVEADLEQNDGEEYDDYVARWTDANDELHRERDGTYLEALLDLARSLGTEPESALPPWTTAMILPGESEAVAKAEKAATRAENAEKSAGKARGDLRQLQRRKKLVSASGGELEQLVQEALEDLGCEVSAGNSGRTDLMVVWKGKTAVIEVKGLAKSAKESNAAQLEKWVSEYSLEHGVLPKGILIVNAWRTKPLGERNESAFPGQMIPYSKQRKHCLLTTSQLLAAWVDGTSVAKRNAFLKALFENDGVLDGWVWSDVISEVVGEKEA